MVRIMVSIFDDNNTHVFGEGEIVKLSTGRYMFKLSAYPDNPIIHPEEFGLTWYENGKLVLGAIFNGGAEIFNNKVILMPRTHKHYRKTTFFDEKIGITRQCLEDYISEVWLLESDDGIHFKRFNNIVICGDGNTQQDFKYGIEDIRIINMNNRYLLVGCGKTKPPFKGTNADRIAIYSTVDFIDITYHGIVSSFDSRNAVPFPEAVNNDHYILLRFHPNIHLGLLKCGIEQLMYPAKYIQEWTEIYNQKDKNILFTSGDYPHEKEKIGPSTQVIKTSKGWLVIYHGVGEISEDICNAYGLKRNIQRGYSICAAILDIDTPHTILCRTNTPIYIPSAPYELYGDTKYPVDVPAVVFPVGACIYGDMLFIYAGAGDKYIILLTCNIHALIEYLWQYCRVV
jgi:predicted GH43/DUF377 family glycosyl hydrolase